MRRSCLLALLISWPLLVLLTSCMSPSISAPQLWIDASPLAGRPDLKVTLSASLRTVLRNSPYTAKADPGEFRWDFGDGYVGIGQTAEHTYTAPGYYEVHAVHVMENGSEITAEAGIVVEPSDISVYPFQEWEGVKEQDDILPFRLEIVLPPETSLEAVQSLVAHLPVQVVGWIEGLGVFEVLLDPEADAKGVTNALLAIPEMQEVAPSYLAEPLSTTPTAVPDDLLCEQLNKGWNNLRGVPGT